MDEMKPVVQADRDAAADLEACSPYELSKTTAEMIRAGQLDRAKSVQAMRAHRLAAYEAGIRAGLAARAARKGFPILSSGGVNVDWQFVADHAKQANANHSQTVQRLAERGGLSWCELYAVVHNRPWQNMDTNEAMLAVRALEARYLAAIDPSSIAPKAEGDST